MTNCVSHKFKNINVSLHMYPLTSFTYALPYLAYALFLMFLSWKETTGKISRKNVRKICLILFLFFFGLRGFVNFDWISYYPMFENMETLDKIAKHGWLLAFVGTNLELVEPGYVFYMSLIKTIWDNWYFFIFLSTLIDLYVFDRFINRYTPIYAFSMLIFCTYNISLEFDVLRNVKALIIFIISFDALFKNQWLKIVLWSLLGISFHLSYLIFIPFYFIGLKDFGTKVWWTIFIIINVIYFFQIPLAHTVISYIGDFLGGRFGEKADGYAINDGFSRAKGFSIGYIMRAFIFIMVTLNYKNILAYDKRMILILNIFLFYIITSIGMTDFYVFCSRMETVLTFSLWILYPLLFFILKGQVRKIYLSIVIIYCILRIVAEKSAVMAYYENILFDAMDFVERYNTIALKILK